MRILHVLDHSLPLHSGYAFRTAAILREQRRLGWDTYQLTGPKQGGGADVQAEVIDGIQFLRTPSTGALLSRIPVARELAQMAATTARLQEIARLIKPDVLHAHSPVLNALPAIRVARRLGIAVIYEIRGFWEDAAVDHGTNRLGGPRYRLTRALETFALHRVDHVTTICEGLRTDIVGRGIPESKVTVVPNAVDISGFPYGTEPDTALKRELGLDGKLIIGFIGSFYAYEGLDLLLGALPIIVDRIPNVCVLLVGGGPQEQALRTLATELGVNSMVLFAGRVPHQEVQRYYSIVDVFAYPRHRMRLTELVTPLKPLEAMAQGRLLVASDVGGHKELIKDGETGMLFEAGNKQSLADTIVRLLEMRDGWPRLREQGRQFVERERTWAQSVTRYRTVFDSLRIVS